MKMMLRSSEIETLISALDAAIDTALPDSDPWNVKVSRLQNKLLKELHANHSKDIAELNLHDQPEGTTII